MKLEELLEGGSTRVRQSVWPETRHLRFKERRDLADLYEGTRRVQSSWLGAADWVSEDWEAFG